MPQMTEAYDWRGRTLVDRDGEKIGKLEELYIDDQTDTPEWALVNTGLFGTKSSFVPLAGAEPRAEDVRVPVEKEKVKDAPKIEPEEELSKQEEARLYEHYGFDYSDSRSGSGLPPADAPPDAGEGSSDRRDQALDSSVQEAEVGGAPAEPAGRGSRGGPWSTSRSPPLGERPASG